MIVVDSSAIVEVLTGASPAKPLVKLIAEGELAAPHLLDAEVLNAMRGLELGGKLKPAQCESARVDYLALTITRYRLDAVADRIWELRHNYNAYDAAYIALAEALDAPLVTCDRKLLPATSEQAEAKLHQGRVALFPRG